MLSRTLAPLIIASAHGLLRSALVSPGKAVSVSIEYTGASVAAIDDLSMELRKAKAAAVWCDDVDAVRCFAAEQATAKGDFPGPVPVFYSGAAEQGPQPRPPNMPRPTKLRQGVTLRILIQFYVRVFCKFCKILQILPN